MDSEWMENIITEVGLFALLNRQTFEYYLAISVPSALDCLFAGCRKAANI